MASEKLEKAFDETIMTMVTTMRENNLTKEEGAKIIEAFRDMMDAASDLLDEVWEQERFEGRYDDETKRRLKEWQERKLKGVNLYYYKTSEKVQKTFDTAIMEMLNTMRENELELEEGKKIFAAFREMESWATRDLKNLWYTESGYHDHKDYAAWKKKFLQSFNLDVNQAQREDKAAREKAAREKLEKAFDATVMTMVTTMKENGLTYQEGKYVIVALKRMESEDAKLLDEVWYAETYEGEGDQAKIEAYQKERLQKINLIEIWKKYNTDEVDEKLEKAFDAAIMEMVNTMREHELPLARIIHKSCAKGLESPF